MFTFTHATLKDLPAILAIERSSFKNPWSEGNLTSELVDSLSSTIIAKFSSNLYSCGYICYKIIPPEAELLRIAARSECRRQGIAQALLDEMFRLLQLREVTTVYLEVSETNRSAITLYEKSGFSVTGSRSRYYDHGTTAALLLQRQLSLKVDAFGKSYRMTK
ncbi:MAG: ribosomal protein S18-alanine N-acetyltransferase [Pseudomonadota bacterium]|nr:ribosomal protein S18-alanine N-acetyltransferase [Pseudomonadota bacterium]